MNRMGACFDRLRYEIFQNLILSPMNTGFLGPAVATVLTVYGIETLYSDILKPTNMPVATVLTVYGIETCNIVRNKESIFKRCNSSYRLRY